MTKAVAIETQGALVDHPQRLGILPTRWFWRDPDNWKLVRGPFAVLSAVVIVLVVSFVRPVLLAGAVGCGVVGLAQGLLERYLRKQVLERRRLHEAHVVLDPIESPGGCEGGQGVSR